MTYPVDGASSHVEFDGCHSTAAAGLGDSACQGMATRSPYSSGGTKSGGAGMGALIQPPDRESASFIGAPPGTIDTGGVSRPLL